ncbi:MAG: DUF1294 domain-containing protein [Chloroflexia bacterium]|nr:DUF1294 domain-containing protein [Chloroflexia bacterium]
MSCCSLTLHLLEALGGWPGALIAQWALHHLGIVIVL